MPRRFDGTLLDVAGAAAMLGTTEKAVRSRAARGLLPHRRWSGRVVFLRAELEQFFASLPGVSIEEGRLAQEMRSGMS